MRRSAPIWASKETRALLEEALEIVSGHPRSSRRAALRAERPLATLEIGESSLRRGPAPREAAVRPAST